MSIATLEQQLAETEVKLTNANHQSGYHANS